MSLILNHQYVSVSLIWLHISCMSVYILPHMSVGIVGYMQDDWDGTGALSPQGCHCFLGLSLTAWGLHPRTAQIRELTELHTLLLLHHRTTNCSYSSFWKDATYIRLNITVLCSFLSVLPKKTSCRGFLVFLVLFSLKACIVHVVWSIAVVFLLFSVLLSPFQISRCSPLHFQSCAPVHFFQFSSWLITLWISGFASHSLC